VKTHDPQWYAEQATKLRDELERGKAQLAGYRRAIEDVESLKAMTGGIDLDEGDVDITPEAGIEILQQRVNEAQAELAALEDLARRNDIPPGTLRGVRLVSAVYEGL
jgi:prefoldin subunit 5